VNWALPFLHGGSLEIKEMLALLEKHNLKFFYEQKNINHSKTELVFKPILV